MTAEKPRRGIVRRIFHGILTMSVTSVVAAGAVFGGLALYGALATQASVSDAPVAAPSLRVAVQKLDLQDSYEVERVFAGQFEAQRSVDLGFEEGGQIAEIKVREGDVVAKGDVLAALDTRLLRAERDRQEASRRALLAEVELATRTNTRQTELQQRGFASDQDVDNSSLALARLEARIAELDAAILTVDVRLSKALMFAPFDGVVGARLLDEGAVTSSGSTVITLLERGNPRFRVGVDPILATSLAIGQVKSIQTEFGIFDATVAQIQPELNETTRTQTVFLDVGDVSPIARATGEVKIPEEIEEQGAWLPISALRSGPRGTWELLTVSASDAGPVAGVEAVEIIAIKNNIAFVRGTFEDEAAYIPTGVHRVVPGERIEISTEGTNLAVVGGDRS